MSGIIFKHFSCVCKHSNQMLTCRLLHLSSSSVKSNKYVRQKLLSITSVLSESLTQCQFMPFRMIYYLERDEAKKYYRQPSVLELTEEKIREICFNENPSSPEKWDDIKVEIMTRCFTLTHENFDSVLMQVLLEQGELQLAQSFMDYLRIRKLKPNFITLCKYMVLCSKNVNLVGQDVILETYEKIISHLNTSVLGSKIVEYLVQGLCATDKWQKSFDYIGKLPKSQLTRETLNALTCAAIRNKDYKLACDILNNWYKDGVSPSSTVFENYVKFIIDFHRQDPVRAYAYFSDLAEYIHNRGIILKEEVVIYIEEYFKRSHHCKTFYSKVGRDGVCSACKNKLKSSTLTTQEFLHLRNSFLKYSVKKSDLFINTTVPEFERYCRFVEKFKPFDIVLDGLNVARAVPDRQTTRNPAGQLFHVVDHLSKSMNRVLVLARNHVKRTWPGPIMRAIERKCFVFYVSNASQDDPFLIYAALASGPKALLVSDDMMRDHISRLPDPKLIYLFKKWQQAHQVYITGGENKDEIILMGPLKHSITIQGNMENGWHVPFDNDIKLEPYEELNNWLCVQK